MKYLQQDGFFNTEKETILEKEYDNYLKNIKTYNFDFSLFQKTKDKNIDELTRVEIINEYNAYFDLYGKFIDMPYESVVRIGMMKEKLKYFQTK